MPSAPRTSSATASPSGARDRLGALTAMASGRVRLEPGATARRLVRVAGVYDRSALGEDRALPDPALRRPRAPYPPADGYALEDGGPGQDRAASDATRDADRGPLDARHGRSLRSRPQPRDRRDDRRGPHRRRRR